MKKVALIPVLLGSTRIPDKNLLLVDGYPMAFYVARACQKAGAFDEIYLNSEHDIVEKNPCHHRCGESNDRPDFSTVLYIASHLRMRGRPNRPAEF